MRRPDAAGCQDDLAAACPPRRSILSPLDRDRTAAVEFDALRETPRFKPQIGIRQRRLEECARGRPPSSAFLGNVEVARALVVTGVEIRGRLDAGLRCGIAKCLQQGPTHPRRFYPQFAADRMARIWPQ